MLVVLAHFIKWKKDTQSMVAYILLRFFDLFQVIPFVHLFHFHILFVLQPSINY